MLMGTPLTFRSVWCPAANSTGMVGYDFGAQSAFVSVGADTDVSGKEVQAR